jgi:polysaccharide export outer membrane protein
MRKIMKWLLQCALMAALGLGALAAAPVPEQVIHPGDQMNVQVFGQPTLSQNVTVLPDGSVNYPLLGRLPLGGMTVNAATALVSQRLSRYVRHPIVTLAITQLGQPQVLVLGDVKTPGKYQLRSDARLTDAIAAAGGVDQVDGPLADARISDPQGDVSQVSLQKMLHDGDVSLDRPLADGDVVYVPGPTQIDVIVTGAVDHPGQIQVNEGDRLAMAIAKAGNSNGSNADLNHIHVIRKLPDGSTKEMTINLYQALENNDMTADIALQKGDTIYVPAQKAKAGGFLSGASSGILYLLGRLIP